jgi:flagellar protein FliS
MRDEMDFLRGSLDGDLVVAGGVFFSRGPAAAYRQSEFLTATPRRLAELLYDGAVRSCRQAVEALDEGDCERARERIGRAVQIFRQLQDSVEPLSAAADAEFRRFCRDVHARLIEADHYRRRETLAEAIALLTDRREDWADLTCEASARGARSGLRAGGHGGWVA